MAGQILLKPKPAAAPSPPAEEVLSLLSLAAPELRERLLVEIERNPVLVAIEQAEGEDEAPGVDPDIDLPVMEWMADLHRPSLRSPVHTPQEVHEGFLRSLPGRPDSLPERLHRQFLLVEGDPWRRWIGEQIIFNLDDRGYVRGDFGRLVASINGGLSARARTLLAETKGVTRRGAFADIPPTLQPDARLASAMLRVMDELGALRTPLVRLLDGLEVTSNAAESVLRTVQGLEPAGVGARDLKECLRLQLADRGAPPLARKLVDRCLADVEAGRLDRAARRLGAPISRVRAAAKLILSLDRAPGVSLAPPEEQGSSPDAVLEHDGGGWRVRLERAGVPDLAVSKGYARESRRTSDPETRVYLAKNFAHAERLVAALRERDRILQRVLEAVIERQRAFLLRGPSALSPVYMKDVAKTTGLPVRTIALAVEGKSVATPYGVLPIRALFASGERRRQDRKSKRGRG